MTKKNLIILLVLSISTLWANVVSAGLIISNVSYTASSVSFTIDGDMSDYARPWSTLGFGLQYQGDIWQGPSTFSWARNQWSGSVFDNKSLFFDGYTINSIFGNTPHSWSLFSSNLSNAVATSNTVTLSFGHDWLNTSALNPTINFVWGWAGMQSGITLLQSVDLSPSQQTAPSFVSTDQSFDSNSSSVPSPTTLALLGLGLLSLSLRLRRLIV